jgi:U3 small nucleolar RNA-associated protein 20
MCLLRVPNLPALAKHIQEIGEFVFKCVQGQSQGGHGIELVQASFRAMASLVRRFDAFEITEAQTKAMVGFVQEDIENYKKQSQAFSVLKSLLARRVMLPELYDLMQRVASLLIRSQDAVTQQHCAHLIVTFVLNYPLGAKRMQQQLEFFINQLEYENSTGRQAAVETMTALFRRLPSETLLSQADLVFFPLVLRLVNDDSRDIRQLVSVALKTLLQRCEAAQLTRLLGFALTWSAAGQQAVMRLAGIQVLGICFEAFTGSDSSKVQKFAVQLLPLVKAVFETEALALDAAVEAYVAQGSTALSTLESQWQLVYHSMLALEKCWKTLPALTEREIKNQKVWPLLQQLSLHPHVWIRTAAARLSGLFYSHILPVIQRSKEFNFKDSLLGSEASAFEAAQHTCSILNSKTVDSKLGEQCISNLVCLSMLLYTSNAQVQLPSTEIESERVPVLASSASLPAEGALEVVSRTRVEKLDEQNQSDDDEGDVEQESEHDELSEDEASEEQSDSDAEKSSKKRAVDVDVESDAEEADEDQVNSEHEQDEPESEAELSESEQDDEVNDTAAKSSRVRHSVFDIAELAMTDSSVAKNRALNWIFHRMSFLSRKASPQTLEYIFQWFATMITQLGSAGIKPYVLPIMFPLHRISSVETTSPRLQQCIEQVMEVLRTVIGATATLEVHAQVRDAVNRVRADRKTARAAQSVTNPQAFAKRKLAQASRKRDAKKRRMEAVKAERRGERPTTALTAKPKQEVVEYDEEGDRIVRVKNPVTLKQAKQQQKRRRTDDQ